jgi:hypothetical protein
VPLHSTRADVERLLGPSADACRCVYKTEREVVTVEYAKHPCRDNPQGWNLPPDTAQLIMVTPRTDLRLADLNLDLTGYNKSEDPHMPGRFHYENDDEGILLVVVRRDEVGSVIYTPTRHDSAHLRCRKAVLQK